MCFFDGQPLELGVSLRHRHIQEGYHWYPYGLLRSNDLYRLLVHDRKGGTQGFMAAHNLVQTLPQGRHIEWTMEAEGARQVIDRAPRLKLLQEP